ncbi:ataxin-7-like protein 1 [Aplysia californica]|uniref:Ataxin-7-like protein 1 n=1 Tax=Aplysia californica TaxID=6500 RepID=A0ABM0JEN6_APLCA|nr:ataxin-7-like protein 1 [Aplysia californica]
MNANENSENLKYDGTEGLVRDRNIAKATSCSASSVSTESNKKIKMATQDSSPSLIIGQQWSAWADLLSTINEIDEEEKGKDGTDKNSSDSMKLGLQDMGLFGFCPSREEFSLVECEKCKLLVKPQALKQHIESRHGPTNLSSLGNVPASALNSELGKKLLMPLPSKSSPPPSSTTSSSSSSSAGRQSSGTFRPASSGRPPTKDSLKQVPAAARINPAPRLGVSMKINRVKSVKSGHRISTATTTASSSSFSNPVVKVEKLDKLLDATSSSLSSSTAASEQLDSSPPDLSNSIIKTEPSPSSTSSSSSKISTLVNGTFKPAVSLTTPSLESSTTSSPSMVSTATLVAVTKTSADTPISTRSVTTFVTSTTRTKPLVIAPVMTVGSAVSMTARPITLKGSKISKEQRERKCLPCKDREYDANKHCGVKIHETGKPCTRSLTCKTHALSLRRAVPGRSKAFDELLKEHKAAKDALIKAKGVSQSAPSVASVGNRVLVSPASISSTMNALKQQQQHNSPQMVSLSGQRDGKASLSPNTGSTSPRILVPSCGVPTTTTFVKPRTQSNVFQRFTAHASLPSPITVKEETLTRQDSSSRLSLSSSSSELQRSDSQDSRQDQSFLSYHPKPMAVCQFGGRMNDRGCFLFSRKTDYVRAAFLSALERHLNPPPHKKLCVESNLPKESQMFGNSQDPYEFNMIDNSGNGGLNSNPASANLVSISSKPTIKPKSKLPSSPVAASSNSMTLSAISLSSPTPAPSLTLQSSSFSSLSAPAISVASATPGLALNWSVKPRESTAASRSPSASPAPALSSAASATNPGKRKRSGSSGAGGNNLIAVAGGNGTLSAVSVSTASASLASAITQQQTGLTGIISSGALNSSQTGNLIAIPSVNLTNAANLGQISAATLGTAKLNPGAAGAATSVHKNNNVFKDFSLVLTGIDSLNGQVVNISSAQLAELAASQGQTLLLNNFTPGSSSSTNSSAAAAAAAQNVNAPTIAMTGSTSATVRPAKRSRTSSSKSSHQSLSNSASKLSANALEGFKLIPSNNVISSGTLPPNAVLLDSLQGAVLTSVALAGGGANPTLVAITSSTANTNSVTVGGNPTQVLCADSSSGQILTPSSLVNGTGQSSYEKSGSSGRHHASSSSKSHHHHHQHNKAQQQQQQQQQGMALGSVLQAASSSLAVPLATGSTAQLCSNQAIFKPGSTFNLAKNVGKLTVQPVSLTFPLVNQQGLAALTSGKPTQLQQQQQQQQQQAQTQQPHTLLVATSGVGASDDQTKTVRVAAGKTELHLQPQISNSSSGNLIS